MSATDEHVTSSQVAEAFRYAELQLVLHHKQMSGHAARVARERAESWARVCEGLRSVRA